MPWSWFHKMNNSLMNWENSLHTHIHSCNSSAFNQQWKQSTSHASEVLGLLFWKQRWAKFRLYSGELDAGEREPHVRSCLCVKKRSKKDDGWGGGVMRACPPSPLSPSLAPSVSLWRVLSCTLSTSYRGGGGCCWSIRIGQQCHRIEQQWPGL